MASCATYPQAFAQTGANPKLEAADLFAVAKTLMDGGHFAEAFPKLRKSQVLDPQVGTLLNLAHCYESVGKMGSACTAWREAGTAAAAKGQVDREALAKEHADRTCADALRVTVEVRAQPGRDLLFIAIDGEPLPRASWGVPVPVDGGEHEIKAVAPGLRPWWVNVTVDPRLAAAMVTVPELPPVPAVSIEPPAAPTADGRPRWLPTAAVITGATGIGAIGVGLALGLEAMLQNQASNDARNCVAANCNETGAGHRDRARAEARVADVLLGVGVGAVVTAAVLWVVAPHGPRSDRGFILSPSFGQNTWSLGVGRIWQ